MQCQCLNHRSPAPSGLYRYSPPRTGGGAHIQVTPGGGAPRRRERGGGGVAPSATSLFLVHRQPAHIDILDARGARCGWRCAEERGSGDATQRSLSPTCTALAHCSYRTWHVRACADAGTVFDQVRSVVRCTARLHGHVCVLR